MFHVLWYVKDMQDKQQNKTTMLLSISLVETKTQTFKNIELSNKTHKVK